MRVVIIGGSDAGISAALRVREVNPAAEVHVIVADAYPNFSICGLPFYLSGEISDWRTLAHRSRAEIEASGVGLHLNETAVALDVAGKYVTTRSQDGKTRTHAYGRLILATGATPVRPHIEGLELPNVFMLHTMADCFTLHERLDQGARSAVIIGGGYIGLEMADALRHRGLEVTLIEQLDSLMRTVDQSIARRVEMLLEAHGVAVRTGRAVRSMAEKDGQVHLHCDDGSTCVADVVLVAVGVRPQSELARVGGIQTNQRGAILVDRAMRTNSGDVFAAGDCVATWHRLLQRDTYLPLGTTSHKQGRIAGENAVGGARSFAGSLGTQSVKLFDRVVAATGLREQDARSYGFDPLVVEISTSDHKVYYPGATELVVRIVGDPDSGALLGAQLFGSYGREVSKRVDTIATALHSRAEVDALNDLDLSYTPPLSSPWDPIQMAAQAWTAARGGLARRELADA